MNDEEEVTNPQEDINDPAHLPVSGEVNGGPVPDDDPLTIDTDDYPDAEYSESPPEDEPPKA